MPNIGDVINGSEIGKRKEKTHDHKFIWTACMDCGKERWVLRQKGKPRSKRCRLCNCKHRSGPANPNWTGGRITLDGYVYIKLLSDDFYFPMVTKDRYIAEHRLVMARSLGRCLYTWEVVHHKNGIRGDNDIKNLELHSDMGHKGIHIMEERIKYLGDKVKELEEVIVQLKKHLLKGA